MEDHPTVHKRRTSDYKMQTLLTSPYAKMIGVVIQGIAAVAITVVSFAATSIVNRLNAIETQFGVLNMSRALNEDQLKQLQAFKQQYEVREVSLRERVSTVEADVRNLKDRAR